MVTLVVAAPWSKAAPFLPLYRRDRVAPGLSVDLRLPPRACWKSRRRRAGGPWKARRKSTCCCLRRRCPASPWAMPWPRPPSQDLVGFGIHRGQVRGGAGGGGLFAPRRHRQRPSRRRALRIPHGLASLGGCARPSPRAEASSAVAGLALDAEGKPLAGGKVVLRSRAARDSLQSAVSDGEGRFRFQVAPGFTWPALPETAPAPA